MNPDRRRASVLYRHARFLGSCTIGLTAVSLVWPDRPYMLPSTALGLIAAGTALLLVSVANFLWGRNR